MTATSHQVASQNSGGLTGNVVPTATPVTGGKLGVPERPQVNLLPAEVTYRRQTAAAQRRLIWAIIASLLVIALGFGGAFLVRANASLNYEEAMATADELMQQRKEYSPVIEVKDSIDATREARGFVLASEVNWASYIYAIAAVLPDDVAIGSLATVAAGAGEGLVTGADALTTNAIGVITFEAVSLTLPDASEWIDAMEAVPGLADANIQSSELSDEDGVTFYEVSATVQVTIDAVANRTFADQVVDEDESATDDEENVTLDAEGGE